MTTQPTRGAIRRARQLVVGGLMISATLLLSTPIVRATPLVATPTSPLEGTTWTVNVAPDGAAKQQGERPFTETLHFKEGKVSMSACMKVGFTASSYTVYAVDNVWSFNTEQVSPKQGKTAWRAKITGAAIHGTLTWIKPDGTIVHYDVDGQQTAGPPLLSATE